MELADVNTSSALLCGFSISVLIARYFIAKAFRNLDSCVEKIEKIHHMLAVISTKLESFDILQAEVREHDREIVALKAQHKTKTSHLKNYP